MLKVSKINAKLRSKAVICLASLFALTTQVQAGIVEYDTALNTLVIDTDFFRDNIVLALTAGIGLGAIFLVMGIGFKILKGFAWKNSRPA